MKRKLEKFSLTQNPLHIQQNCPKVLFWILMLVFNKWKIILRMVNKSFFKKYIKKLHSVQLEGYLFFW